MISWCEISSCLWYVRPPWFLALQFLVTYLVKKSELLTSFWPFTTVQFLITHSMYKRRGKTWEHLFITWVTSMSYWGRQRGGDPNRKSMLHTCVLCSEQDFCFANIQDSSASIDTTQKALKVIQSVWNSLFTYVDIDIIHMVNASDISFQFWDQKLDEGEAQKTSLLRTNVVISSLVPRPRPAFRHLQYGKAGRAWYLFSREPGMT